MAYTVPIYTPKCVVCGAKATVTVMNARNAKAGDYCATHGKARVKELTEAGA